MAPARHGFREAEYGSLDGLHDRGVAAVLAAQCGQLVVERYAAGPQNLLQRRYRSIGERFESLLVGVATQAFHELVIDRLDRTGAGREFAGSAERFLLHGRQRVEMPQTFLQDAVGRADEFRGSV